MIKKKGKKKKKKKKKDARVYHKLKVFLTQTRTASIFSSLSKGNQLDRTSSLLYRSFDLKDFMRPHEYTARRGVFLENDNLVKLPKITRMFIAEINTLNQRKHAFAPQTKGKLYIAPQDSTTCHIDPHTLNLPIYSFLKVLI